MTIVIVVVEIVTTKLQAYYDREPTQLNSTQREFTDAGELPQCPHLFIKTKLIVIKYCISIVLHTLL